MLCDVEKNSRNFLILVLNLVGTNERAVGKTEAVHILRNLHVKARNKSEEEYKEPCSFD